MTERSYRARSNKGSSGDDDEEEDEDDCDDEDTDDEDTEVDMDDCDDASDPAAVLVRFGSDDLDGKIAASELLQQQLTDGKMAKKLKRRRKKIYHGLEGGQQTNKQTFRIQQCHLALTIYLYLNIISHMLFFPPQDIATEKITDFFFSTV